MIIDKWSGVVSDLLLYVIYYEYFHKLARIDCLHYMFNVYFKQISDPDKIG